MRNRLLLFLMLFSVAALSVRAGEEPAALLPTDSLALPKDGDTLTISQMLSQAMPNLAVRSEKPRRKDRFLPMRRRIDREIDKNKFIYRGEVMMGLTASYGTLSSDDTDFLLLVEHIDAEGTMATVNPFFGYAYRDNRVVGVRFGYRHIGATLGNLGFNLGEENDLSGEIGDMELTSDNFSFALFHRTYVGLDQKGRFGLFAELEASFMTGTSRFSYLSGDEPKYNNSNNIQVKLSFNPGVAVYIFPNVCGTLSFGLGGIQYAHVTQKNDAGERVGSRDASKMRFRLNLADINIGMTVHLWDKKKK